MSKVSSVVLSVAALAVAVSGYAADVVVGDRQAHSIYGAQTLSDRVIQSENADLYKTGDGTLTVEQLAQTNTPLHMKVLSGKVALTAGTPATLSLTPPSVITEKAAVWLDASDAQSLLDASGTPLTLSETPQDVRKWVDRRAADSPNTYTYFIASNALGTVAANVGYPRGYITNGYASVYFRGYGSGVYMDAYSKNNAQTAYSPYHVFVVHAVDNTWGYIFGCRSGDAYWYDTSANHKPYSTITRMQCPAPTVLRGVYSSNWLLNGRWVDVYNTPPLQTTQLLEQHQTANTAGFSALFASKAQTLSGQTGSAVAVGGDRLHEFILFNKRLTEAEQAVIRDYLMRKWGLSYGYASATGEKRGGRYAQTYALSEDATLEAEPATNVETYPVAFSGKGSVVKKGAGVLAVGPSDEAVFGGTFDLQEGKVLTRGGRLPALAAQGGETISAAAEGVHDANTEAVRKKNGAALTKTTGGTAGVVVKSGTETARINAFAADVSRIEVSGGELILEAPLASTFAPTSVASNVTVTGTNLDFEASQTTSTWAWGSGTNGWWCYDTTCYFSGYWNQMSWGIPQGTRCLSRSTTADAYTTVTFPAAGTYELSFLHSARSWTNTLGDKNRTVTDVGIAKYVDDKPSTYWGKLTRIGTYRGAVVSWPRMYLRFTVAEAGKYVIGFEGRNMSGVDNHVWIDDIKFRYITEPTIAGAYEIPNGDFEQIPAGAYNRSDFCVTNQCTGWTFTQPETIKDARIGTIEPHKDAAYTGQFLSGDPRTRGSVQHVTHPPELGHPLPHLPHGRLHAFAVC